MKELIPTINEIVKYGLQPNLTAPDKEKLLERHLVKIYDLYFDIKYTFYKTEKWIATGHITAPVPKAEFRVPKTV